MIFSKSDISLSIILICFFSLQIRRRAEECEDRCTKFFGALALDKILATQLQKYSSGRRSPALSRPGFAKRRVLFAE